MTVTVLNWSWRGTAGAPGAGAGSDTTLCPSVPLCPAQWEQRSPSAPAPAALMETCLNLIPATPAPEPGRNKYLCRGKPAPVLHLLLGPFGLENQKQQIPPNITFIIKCWLHFEQLFSITGGDL